MKKEQITFHCNGKENKGLISQLWYKESGLINKDQDQFLGEKLVLKNLQKETEGTYVCVERDKHGHEIAYKRELQIVQKPRLLNKEQKGPPTGRVVDPIIAYNCDEKRQVATA